MRSVIRALTVSALLLAPSAAPAWAASVFVIRGGGDGHGVGMSQYGAYGFALHGYSYKQILMHYFQGTTLATVNADQVVRVLLGTGTASFSGATRAASKALKAGRTYSVQALADGQLALTGPSGKRVGVFDAPLTVTGPGPLTVGGRGSYRGALEFRPQGGGSGVETINAVGLDDYVLGVVTAEMPAGWAPQALEAQAVAARTYALTSDVGAVQYQLYSDTRSQQYGGVGAETASGDAAVAATSGKIVTYKGTPAITYFFSSSGGHTEDVQNVFRGSSPEPWLRGVSDPYDGAAGDPYHRWTYRQSVKSAAAKLTGLVKGTLRGIRVTERGTSPRILTAQVVGAKGWSSTTGTDLEQRFGLASTSESFETITTDIGTVAHTLRRPAVGRSPDPVAVTAETASVMSALVGQVLAPRTPAIYGTVFPGSKGSPLDLERLSRGRWRTVAAVHLGAAGRYAVRAPGPGTYRIELDGFAGSSVALR